MITIIDYDTGNLRSVANALGRLGAEYRITADPAAIRAAERVLLPGVGEASSAMAKLRERGLPDVIRSLKCPVLGICIGVQLLCRRSEEGDTECLGIFDNEVRRLRTEGLKVPHMGWDSIEDLARAAVRRPRRRRIRLLRPLLRAADERRHDRPDDLRRDVQRRDPARQLLRNAVSPGKERFGRRAHPAKLFETMIEVIPAIDLIGGQCVRLTQGDYDRKTTYYKDPLDAALRYEECGAGRLHMVDLDGAKASRPANLGVLERIAARTSLEVQYGGGIKSTEALRDVFGSGLRERSAEASPSPGRTCCDSG